MMKLLTISLKRPHAAYIEPGVLLSSSFFDDCRSVAERWVIIADHTTEKLFGHQLQKNLYERGLSVELVAFKSGEGQKTRQTKEWLEDQLLQKGFGRDCGVIGLGGGVVTDVAGFVASTYCRGLPLILIPTTLLGMVDASIGGKTGVNTPQGKNLIGTIYQPHAIWIDPLTLNSLPFVEYKNGLAECIKHGAILDPTYFAFLEEERVQILTKDPEVLPTLIGESCHIKKTIVEEDEREQGMRRLLNFGHTLGHALEVVTRYALPHGQAVAIGMVGESWLAKELGILPEDAFDRIYSILKNYGLPTNLPEGISASDLLQAMQHDKKAKAKVPRFVMLEEIGSCLECEGEYCQSVEPQLVERMIESLPRQ